jgi:hypothetical protein
MGFAARSLDELEIAGRGAAADEGGQIAHREPSLAIHRSAGWWRSIPPDRRAGRPGNAHRNRFYGAGRVYAKVCSLAECERYIDVDYAERIRKLLLST